MGVPFVLDEAAANWLAELDPALALLPSVLPPYWSDPQRLLDDVQWTPRQRLRLAYRVRADRSPPTFLAVDVGGDGSSEFDFRGDSGLPGLQEASEAEAVTGLLGRNLGRVVTGCRIRPVRYRPGSRCVLRYDMQIEDGICTLFAKCLSPDCYEAVCSRTTGVAARLEGAGAVPGIVAVWPQMQVIVTRGIPGRSFSAIMGDPTVPTRARLQLAHRVGGRLAQFHGQADHCATTWTTNDELSTTAKSTGAMLCVDGRLGSRLLTMLDTLAAAAPDGSCAVLGHGGFRGGQVICGSQGSITILDTDGVCLSDPGRDLGSMLAHLVWQGMRQPGQRRVLRAAERSLVEGYETSIGRVDPQRLRWWRTAALLQLAARRYSRLETSFWPLIPALLDVAGDELTAPHAMRSRGDGPAELADKRWMSTVVPLALAPAAADPLNLRIEKTEELATASRRRSVVRYTVRGLDGDGRTQVIGKLFSEKRRADLMYRHLRLLSGGPFRNGKLRVPEPLAFVAQHRLVLYRSCPGVPLDRLLHEAGGDSGVREAARWVARLHGSGESLPRTFSMVDERNSSRHWAMLVGQTYPELAGQARALAARWGEVAESLGVRCNVPIHKDFHAGHVLVADVVSVIDLDEARQGDPAFDVAHFCAYLSLHGADDVAPKHHCRVFLDEYAAAGGRVDPGAYAAFAAYSWLKIAKQWTEGSGPGRGASPAQRRAGTRRALLEGARCLNA